MDFSEKLINLLKKVLNMDCSNCKKKMEEGIFVTRGGSPFSVRWAYWCKEDGFFKVKDKVLISPHTGSNKFKASICKNCKNLTIKYN